MSNVKVSVIMLTYNREKYISRAIESIQSQDFDCFEFIIIDNGSTDNSGKIALEYSKIDKRIIFKSINKSTIGKGRNEGLNLSSGDYITFVDDDDTAEPDMLKFLYELAVSNNADMSICGSYKNVDGVTLPNCVYDELIIMSPEDAVIELLKRRKYNAAMPTKMLKRYLFDILKFKENGKYDDITATYKYIANAQKIAYYGLPKYSFYRHINNNSSFTTNDLLLTPEQLDEYFDAFKERTEYLSKKLPSITDYAQYSEWSYMISMCNKINKNNLVNCKLQLSHINNVLQQNYDKFYYSPYIENFEKEFMDKYIRRE